MHEMALCESVLQIIEEHARRERFHRVLEVRLEIGALAGVEIDAMRFGFDVVCRGTLADGARLEIVEMPARAHCFDCGETVPVAERYDPCPRCGGYRLQVTEGDQMRIKDLEVE